MDKSPVYLTGLIVTSLIVTSLIVATVMALEVVDTIESKSATLGGYERVRQCQRIKNARCDSGHSFHWMIIEA